MNAGDFTFLGLTVLVVGGGTLYLGHKTTEPEPIHWPKAILLDYPRYGANDIPQGCPPGFTSVQLLTAEGSEERCIVAVNESPAVTLWPSPEKKKAKP